MPLAAASRGARQASQIDNVSAAPLGGVLDTADNASSHRLPSVINAWRQSYRRSLPGLPGVMSAAAAPLGRLDRRLRLKRCIPTALPEHR